MEKYLTMNRDKDEFYSLYKSTELAILEPLKYRNLIKFHFDEVDNEMPMAVRVSRLNEVNTLALLKEQSMKKVHNLLLKMKLLLCNSNLDKSFNDQYERLAKKVNRL